MNRQREILNQILPVSKENSRDKLPTIDYKNNRQRGSPNIVVSTESPKSDDIRNTSRNTNTKDIKILMLGDRMVKHVQGWDITKRTDNKRKVYVKYYMKRCIRENSPDHLIIFHVEANDVPSIKKQNVSQSQLCLRQRK